MNNKNLRVDASMHKTYSYSRELTHKAFVNGNRERLFGQFKETDRVSIGFEWGGSNLSLAALLMTERHKIHRGNSNEFGV